MPHQRTGSGRSAAGHNPNGGCRTSGANRGSPLYLLAGCRSVGAEFPLDPRWLVLADWVRSIRPAGGEVAVDEVIAELAAGVEAAEQGLEIGDALVERVDGRGWRGEQLSPVRSRVQRSELLLDGDDHRRHGVGVLDPGKVQGHG